MANPTSVLDWDAFAGADDYDVALVSVGGDANTPAGVIRTVNTLISQLDLKDLFTGPEVDGTYAIQVRANVGAYSTNYSAPANVVWDDNVPGVPGGITVDGVAI